MSDVGDGIKGFLEATKRHGLAATVLLLTVLGMTIVAWIQRMEARSDQAMFLGEIRKFQEMQERQHKECLDAFRLYRQEAIAALGRNDAANKENIDKLMSTHIRESDRIVKAVERLLDRIEKVKPADDPRQGGNP